MTNLTKKRILLVHGLASKPPEIDLHAYWSRCIVENIRVDDPGLAGELEAHPEVLVSGYWANAIPHHIEDDTEYVAKLEERVEATIRERQELGDDFHVGRGRRIGAFFKSRGLDLVNVFSNALTIKDNVAKHYLTEIELYSEDQYIADRIREPLERGLREAWDAGSDVTLLTHSMGTFLAYDVLWRFSHRTGDGYEPYRDKRVKMFVTMGSPLGDGMVRKLLFANHHKDGTDRHYPTNIDRWHNYACLGDVVSHEHDFKDEFFKDMRKIGLLDKNDKYSAIDYVNLHNPFQVVSHKGNRRRSKRNPHKSYGYLVQPRLGTWLADFLAGRLR